MSADPSGAGLGGGDRLAFPGSHDPSTSSPPPTSAGGASIRSFEWIDENADLVGGNGNAAQADGNNDQHLRLAIDLPPNTIVEELVVTSGEFDRWVTKPNDRFWPVAIFQHGRPVARSHVAQVGVYSGPQKFDLYLNSTGGIGPGSPFDLRVVVSIAGNPLMLGSQCKRPELAVELAWPRPDGRGSPSRLSQPDVPATPSGHAHPSAAGTGH